jgi:flavin reductase (DIM6/NTAB) family NADH-FMN oxidoreductase RutF
MRLRCVNGGALRIGKNAARRGEIMATNDLIGPALGRIPSGCAIVTLDLGDQKTAMLASWVQQAAFAPPAITVAINKERWFAGRVERGVKFGVNVVGENTGPMFKQFGKGFAPGEAPFAGVATHDLNGTVALDDAAASLACTLVEIVDAGDHWVWLGRVTAGQAKGDARPYVHLRKDGLNY